MNHHEVQTLHQGQGLYASPLDNIDHLLAGQLAASSIAMYRRDIAAYQKYAEAHALDPMDAQTLASWRDSLALESTMSPNTINRMIAAVKRIVKQAASRDLIAADVAIHFELVKGVKVKALKKRLKQNSRTRIETDDMRLLCDLPDTNTLVGKRDRALLHTLASSGLRASELATLSTSQIVKQGRGYILKIEGKTDVGFRDAHLSAEAYHYIQDWLAARPLISQFVFTAFDGRGDRVSIEHVSDTGVWKIVQKYAKQAGLAHIKPHDLRRFVGTQLAAKDIRRAQLALGHKSIEVTARHYVLDKLTVGETDHLY